MAVVALVLAVAPARAGHALGPTHGSLEWRATYASAYFSNGLQSSDRFVESFVQLTNIDLAQGTADVAAYIHVSPHGAAQTDANNEPGVLSVLDFDGVAGTLRAAGEVDGGYLGPACCGPANITFDVTIHCLDRRGPGGPNDGWFSTSCEIAYATGWVRSGEWESDDEVLTQNGSIESSLLMADFRLSL